jgi:hypothetical protein
MIAHAFCFTSDKHGFHLQDNAKYIDDSINAFEGDVLINYLKSNQFTMNLVNEPIRGSREKPPTLLQQLIEICCPPGGSVLDLTVGTSINHIIIILIFIYFNYHTKSLNFILC